MLDNLPIDEVQRLAEEDQDCDKRREAVSELVRRVQVAEKKAPTNENLQKQIDRLRAKVDILDKERRVKGYRESNTLVLTGFTPQGGVAVLINSMSTGGTCIQAAEKELCGDKPDPWLINGQLYSAASCLKSVLDGLANYCQLQKPMEEFAGVEVHFANYRFVALCTSHDSKNRLCSKAPTIT
ncbi:hypothetical protein ABBQ38_011911 [Trebouxia sp. C0009 RCD-2024]